MGFQSQSCMFISGGVLDVEFTYPSNKTWWIVKLFSFINSIVITIHENSWLLLATTEQSLLFSMYLGLVLADGQVAWPQLWHSFLAFVTATCCKLSFHFVCVLSLPLTSKRASHVRNIVQWIEFMSRESWIDMPTLQLWAIALPFYPSPPHRIFFMPEEW